MKSAFYIEFLLLICLPFVVIGQIRPTPVPGPEPATDTLPATDTISPIRGMVRFSADTLDDYVDYNARDSIRFDNVNRMIYLYGEASIKYQNYSITADYIQVDLDSNLAVAEQLPDSLKQLDDFAAFREEAEEPDEEVPIDTSLLDSLGSGALLAGAAEPKERNEDGRPYFDDGNSQFTAHRLRYNFNTRKGKVYDVVTEESNMFIHGSETKIVSAADSTMDDYVYSHDVILTTCNADDPHYGIRSRKQKIIPDRQVIVGPSNLELAGVPTPLILPFGFSQSRKALRMG